MVKLSDLGGQSGDMGGSFVTLGALWATLEGHFV